MTGYSLTAQFRDGVDAVNAYNRISSILQLAKAPLSVYRFEMVPWHYVVVIGESEDLKLFARLAGQMMKYSGQLIQLDPKTHDDLLILRAKPTPLPPQSQN
jgi:hypothetical protein